MSDWILIACLVKLRAEFDAMAPGRDHDSDGSIGDAAHQQEVSDHNPDETGSVPIHDADHINEVHAIDVDVELRVPGLSMETVVQFLLARCRSGAEKRLRYIIYNRRIWQAKNGWRQEAYTGPSPHREHAHFSASYDSDLEASTAPWGLVSHFGKADIVEQADIDKVINGVVDKLTAVHDFPATDKLGGQFTELGAAFSTGYPQLPGSKRTAAWFNLQAMHVDVKAILAALAAQDHTGDVQAIVAGVLAGLDPALIAAAIPEDLAAQVADELHARHAA